MKLKSLIACAFALTGATTSMIVDAADMRVRDMVKTTEDSRKARKSLANLASKDSVEESIDEVLKMASPLLAAGVKTQISHTHMAHHFNEIPDNFLEGQRNIKGKEFGKFLKSLLGKFNPQKTVTPGHKVLVGLEQALSSKKIVPFVSVENPDQIGDWILTYEMTKSAIRGANILSGGDAQDGITSELALRFLKSVVLRINAAAIDEDDDDSMTSGEERLIGINFTDEEEVEPQYSQAWYATDFLQRLAMDTIRFASKVEAKAQKEEVSDSDNASEEEEEEVSEHSDSTDTSNEQLEEESSVSSIKEKRHHKASAQKRKTSGDQELQEEDNDDEDQSSASERKPSKKKASAKRQKKSLKARVLTSSASIEEDDSSVEEEKTAKKKVRSKKKS